MDVCTRDAHEQEEELTKSPPALQFRSLDLTRGTNTFPARNDMEEGRCRVVNAVFFPAREPKSDENNGLSIQMRTPLRS